jgi:hypothetical protein
MNQDFWDKSAEIVILIAYFAAFLFGMGILGWQVFHWLRTSDWVPIEFSAAFVYFGVDLMNVYFPSDWQGLAKVARWVLAQPLTLAVPICLISVGHIWYSFITNRSS